MVELDGQKEKVKILLFGFIDLNLMDGSAVFLSGITSMLSQSPDLEIDLVLASPIRRDLLLQPLLNLPNVNIIIPYHDPYFTAKKMNWVEAGRMTPQEASEVIHYYWKETKYDWLLIRGMQVAEYFLEISSDILSKTLLYVTGITNESQNITSVEKQRIHSLFIRSAYLLCQTEEMKKFIIEAFPQQLNHSKIIILNPMIPDTSSDFHEVFQKKNTYMKLCYTGKFAMEWNSIPIITAFKELNRILPSLSLEVAGDKFNPSSDHPNFKQDMIYHLNNTNNVIWHGAVSREHARDIIVSSDIGITWRHKVMDKSLELSTKLLEYGSLGKAVILNRTDMHVRIFGEDYPLYANTREDFIHAVIHAATNPEVYEQAAKRMFEVSQQFTYTSTLKKIIPILLKNKIVTSFQKRDFQMPIQDEREMLENHHLQSQLLLQKNRVAELEKEILALLDKEKKSLRLSLEVMDRNQRLEKEVEYLRQMKNGREKWSKQILRICKKGGRKIYYLLRRSK